MLPDTLQPADAEGMIEQEPIAEPVVPQQVEPTETVSPEAKEGEKETVGDSKEVEDLRKAVKEARAIQAGATRKAQEAERQIENLRAQLQASQDSYEGILRRQLQSMPEEDRVAVERDIYQQRAQRAEAQVGQSERARQIAQAIEERDDRFDASYVEWAQELGVQLEDSRIDWAYDTDDLIQRMARRQKSFRALERDVLKEKAQASLNEEKKKHGFGITEPAGVGSRGSDDEFLERFSRWEVSGEEASKRAAEILARRQFEGG